MPRASERSCDAGRRVGLRRLLLPRTGRIALAAMFLVAGLALGVRAAAAQGGGEVVVVDLEGAIDRVTARFLSRALGDAAERGAELVVVRLDTPGGLLDATRDMVDDISGSRVPIVVYVAPEGVSRPDVR